MAFINTSYDSESTLHEQNTHTYTSHDGSRLQMLSETRKFLKASQNGESIESFHDSLREVANDLNVQRIILYKVNGTMAEVILALGDIRDKTLVTELTEIHSNPNLFRAVQTKMISNIPVEGIGIDAAIPIGGSGVVLGVDTIDAARTFTRKEIVILELLAKSIIHAYDAGKAIHKLGLDPLTGLWNRRALDGIIDDGKDIFGLPAPEVHGVAFLDIDRFKQINDTHGHAIGDQVLKRVGNVLSASMKAIGGSAFRYGGEEFVGLFSEEVQQDRIDMIRYAIEQDRHEVDTLQLRVTISIGFALKSNLQESINKGQYPHQAIGRRPAQTLAKLADKAAYEAKRRGRNQVVAWPYETNEGQ